MQTIAICCAKPYYKVLYTEWSFTPLCSHEAACVTGKSLLCLLVINWVDSVSALWKKGSSPPIDTDCHTGPLWPFLLILPYRQSWGTERKTYPSYRHQHSCSEVQQAHWAQPCAHRGCCGMLQPSLYLHPLSFVQSGGGRGYTGREGVCVCYVWLCIYTYVYCVGVYIHTYTCSPSMYIWWHT